MKKEQKKDRHKERNERRNLTTKRLHPPTEFHQLALSQCRDRGSAGNCVDERELTKCAAGAQIDKMATWVISNGNAPWMIIDTPAIHVRVVGIAFVISYH